MRTNEISDRRQQCPSLRRAELYTQLLIGMDYPAGTGMLAQNQGMAAADDGRIDSLVVADVLEQAVDVYARFMAEHRLADQTFAAADGVARGLALPE